MSVKAHKGQVFGRSITHRNYSLEAFVDFEAITDLEPGDVVYISKAPHSTVSGIFSECCDNAKSGDTNALAALPYLAELMIKEAHK